MVFNFQKILFLEFRVARFSKKRPGSVRGFKNMRTAGQISGWVWTRPSPSTNQQQQATKEGIPWEIRIKQSQQIYAMIFHGGFQKHVALPSTLWEPWKSSLEHQKYTIV